MRLLGNENIHSPGAGPFQISLPSPILDRSVLPAIYCANQSPRAHNCYLFVVCVLWFTDYP